MQTNNTKPEDKELIKELRETKSTLIADGYKDWSYAVLSIDNAIKALSIKTIKLTKEYFLDQKYKPVTEKIRTYFSVDLFYYLSPDGLIKAFPNVNGFMISYKGVNRKDVSYVHEFDELLNSLSPSSTAPQPLDSIVDEYYDVYCPSKGITGIYTDNFVAFLSEGFTIQKKQPLTKLSEGSDK